MEAAQALGLRGDEETFGAAAGWCADGDPSRQAFGADVLARLTTSVGGRAGVFAARAVPVLRELAREVREADVVLAVVRALGAQGDASVLPDVLRHAVHPDARVRRGVAVAVTGLVPEGHREGVAALVALARDGDAAVRAAAVHALAVGPDDSPTVRGALAARLEDRSPEPVVAAEAARGLAMRRDERAVGALEALLVSADPDGRAYGVALDALEHVRDETVRRRLESALPRRRA
nr:HEAT repeat domain-containing protein [Streptomyces thermolilacinus]